MALFQLPVLPEVILRRTLRTALTRSGLPAADTDRYVASMAGSALTGALNWYRGLPLAALGSSSGRIAVPTTYVWGRRDFALGKVGADRTAAQVVADYRLVVLDAGHWLPETRAEQVATAILDRVGLS